MFSTCLMLIPHNWTVHDLSLVDSEINWMLTKTNKQSPTPRIKEENQKTVILKLIIAAK